MNKKKDTSFTYNLSYYSNNKLPCSQGKGQKDKVMMNMKKINAILNKICEVSELSRFEIIVGQGVGTQFGVKVEEAAEGKFVEIKLYYECEIPGDILHRTQEMIYRSFVIDSDRVLYRFVSSDGDDTYYLP